MISKVEAGNKLQIAEIQKIAEITWPIAFGEILSTEQLDYMMKMMYSTESLVSQFSKNNEFFLYYSENVPVAFLGIEKKYRAENSLKIHKLYVLPNQQGKGIGAKLVSFSENICKEEKIKVLTLNVNRFNKASEFYLKLGFTNVKSEDIEIGKDYLMEDFVMEKRISL
jgi:GNAT superfamily N-acetyltransferase